MQRFPIQKSIIATLVGLALTGVAQAASVDEIQSEIATQKSRLEKLEEQLKATAATTAVATQRAEAATKAVASAGSSAVSVYGIADAGVEIGDYGQGTKIRVQSGLGSASRLGFKGKRRLDDDLNAYFQLETGISIDNGQNTGHSSNVSNPGQGSASSASVNSTGIAVFSRNTFVGLNSKAMGDIRLGRDYAPIYSITNASDPFSIGGATAFRLWSSAAASRFDNAVFYSTPTLAGLRASLAYSAGMENNSKADVGVTGGASGNTNTGPADEGKGGSASLTYSDGPLFVGTGYLSYYKMGSVSAPASKNAQRKSWNLAATYDFGAAKLYAQYLHGQDTQEGAVVGKTLDRDVWWLGVSAPLGEKQVLKAVYAHLDDRLGTNRDSAHFGVGYEYRLDKQTDFYAYYATVSNENGGQNSLCAGGTCQGYDKDSGLPPNFSPKSLMTGMRYRF